MMSQPPTSHVDILYSRRQIEGLIADGRSIIIVDSKVLKVDPWLKYHPGGEKAMMHMVGRDATDEVNALHSAEARLQMSKYQIGRVEGRWKNFLPPIQGGKFRSYVGEASEYDVEESSLASCSDDSRPPSPIFDNEKSHPRRRRTQTVDRSSSVSSESSVPDADSDGEFAHLDAYTRKALDLDLSKYPALDLKTQEEIVRKYRLLGDRIRADGLYNCNYAAYAVESCRYLFFFAMFIFCLRAGWYGCSGAFLGCLWHQLSFTTHDAGHMGITHNYTVDTVIGMLISNYIGGLSLGWWKRTHNVHHIVTNSPEHDPDNQHMPFFALSPQFLRSIWSTYHERLMPFDAFAKVLVPYQAYLYYPILTFGRFNLYAQSWIYLMQGQGPRKGRAAWHRWFEVAGEIFFWIWYGYFVCYKSIPTGWGRFAFIMISHMITMPLHVQITVSHFAMSTAELGPQESFPQKMLRTTMDVDCPQWLDFFHGGLQFQAIHHLYPRIPRHNLRATQKLVQEFCIDVKIPYALYGFVGGNKKVIGHLGDIGRQAAILAKCQRKLAEKGDILHGH